MHLRALDAEVRVEAPGALRRILFPRFGAQPFAGIGALRAVHLLSLQAGATLPAVRLANLSVLRVWWEEDSDRRWLLRQDCGAGAELPVWTATAALQGVELWVQSRRSNGIAARHAQALTARDVTLAQAGDCGWDTALSVYQRDGASAARSEGQPLWWQQLSGSARHGASTVEAGDGLCSVLPPVLQSGYALDLRAG